MTAPSRARCRRRPPPRPRHGHRNSPARCNDWSTARRPCWNKRPLRNRNHCRCRTNTPSRTRCRCRPPPRLLRCPDRSPGRCNGWSTTAHRRWNTRPWRSQNHCRCQATLPSRLRCRCCPRLRPWQTHRHSPARCNDWSTTARRLEQKRAAQARPARMWRQEPGRFGQWFCADSCSRGHPYPLPDSATSQGKTYQRRERILRGSGESQSAKKLFSELPPKSISGCGYRQKHQESPALREPTHVQDKSHWSGQPAIPVKVKFGPDRHDFDEQKNGDDTQCGNRCAGCSKGQLVSLNGLLEAVEPARRSGDDGFVAQMTADVGREAVGGFVTARAVFLQALHHDPVEVGGNCGLQIADCGFGEGTRPACSFRRLDENFVRLTSFTRILI